MRIMDLTEDYGMHIGKYIPISRCMESESVQIDDKTKIAANLSE